MIEVTAYYPTFFEIEKACIEQNRVKSIFEVGKLPWIKERVKDGILYSDYNHLMVLCPDGKHWVVATWRLLKPGE